MIQPAMAAANIRSENQYCPLEKFQESYTTAQPYECVLYNQFCGIQSSTARCLQKHVLQRQQGLKMRYILGNVVEHD